METVLPVPVRNVGNRTKTNGTARRVAHHPAHGIDNVAKGLSPLPHSNLLFAVCDCLIDQLVERLALLGGADGSHDWIPYDVAILIDDIRCREREQI